MYVYLFWNMGASREKSALNHVFEHPALDIDIRKRSEQLKIQIQFFLKIYIEFNVTQNFVNLK